MGENKQVLVADDEDNLRRVLKAQLQHDGYEAHGVADGEAVLQAMAEHHIDVLITDLRMPKLDGMQVLKSVSERFPQRAGDHDHRARDGRHRGGGTEARGV